MVGDSVSTMPLRSNEIPDSSPVYDSGALRNRDTEWESEQSLRVHAAIPRGKRAFDIVLSGILMVALSPIFLLLAILVRLTSKGPSLYRSERVGLNNHTFSMPKFRSMRVDTPEVAPHLLKNPKSHLSPIGSFLRKSSLDELPQLWSIFRGHLSFVGPRPALYNEHELIALRTKFGIHRIVPGLTGWAQVNGRNSLGMHAKVTHDAEYIQHRSIRFDCHILALTVKKVLRSEGISH